MNTVLIASYIAVTKAFALKSNHVCFKGFVYFALCLILMFNVRHSLKCIVRLKHSLNINVFKCKQ